MFKPMRSAAAASLMAFMAFAFAGVTAGIFIPVGDAMASPASDQDDAKLQSDSLAALNALYAKEPEAKKIGEQSKAILVFPKIVKAGLMVGGLSGNGALMQQGKVIGQYNISAASFGLQAGAQSFSQVMFFRTASALQYLDKTSGWSVGVGPSVVVVDSGMAKSMTTDTLTSDVYIFIFGQKGLMGGLGVQGQKVTRLKE